MLGITTFGFVTIAACAAALGYAMAQAISSRSGRRYWAVSAMVIGLGILALAVSVANPSEVKPDGVLYEPFFAFTPLGFLLMLVGAGAVLARLGRQFGNRRLATS
jgi:peptidoglycan/LPS O-acetylase OafA/YrhL